MLSGGVLAPRVAIAAVGCCRLKLSPRCHTELRRGTGVPGGHRHLVGRCTWVRPIGKEKVVPLNLGPVLFGTKRCVACAGLAQRRNPGLGGVGGLGDKLRPRIVLAAGPPELGGSETMSTGRVAPGCRLGIELLPRVIFAVGPEQVPGLFQGPDLFIIGPEQQIPRGRGIRAGRLAEASGASPRCRVWPVLLMQRRRWHRS